MNRLAGLALLAGGCSAVATGDPLIVDADATAGPAIVAPAPVAYTADRTLSPLSPEIAHRLADVISAGPGRTEVVAKIGDSHTTAHAYLQCFETERHLDLAGRDDLRPTIDWFTASIQGGPSWARTSFAAHRGWAAFRALAGEPSPIDRELAAANPAFATVMFGTNDIGLGAIDRFGRNLLDITDVLLARGVVPILSTIPPRGDDPSADAWVPPYNAVVRAVAQARQVPLIDLHRELMALPGHGLTGDRIHLNSRSTACDFSPLGLASGNNRRNLLTLEMLDRLRRTVLSDEPAPDPDPPRLAGDGTAAAPIAIPSLPFGDGRDTRGVTTGQIHYRLVLAAKTKVRAYVIDRRGQHDAWLVGADVAKPVTRLALATGAHLDAGTYDLVVATRGERAGEYLLAITTY